MTKGRRTGYELKSLAEAFLHIRIKYTATCPSYGAPGAFSFSRGRSGIVCRCECSSSEAETAAAIVTRRERGRA
jgi:hypothetical protein